MRLSALLKASQMRWHSLDSNPSLADSNVGALPQCPLLPTGVSGLHPLTQHPSVRDSSPGQDSESWHWTLTLVCQPPSHKASTHVPGLSLGSAAWAGLGNGCAADKSCASCPCIARRAKVTQAFLRSITTPGVPGPPPRQFRGDSGGGCRRKGGVGQEEVGRGSADPQTFLAYATPSLPTSTWASFTCTPCRPFPGTAPSAIYLSVSAPPQAHEGPSQP